ncbi:hypothetical protein [uncultured Microscilla sp.]|uniref:hypothetical protein n=1 Tax=uncultured Microscilla sp. TaxID=432653 RepID=UPI002631FD21|nr:hypothetical protein [uncultured Microscilla sp.]
MNMVARISISIVVCLLVVGIVHTIAIVVLGATSVEAAAFIGVATFFGVNELLKPKK